MKDRGKTVPAPEQGARPKSKRVQVKLFDRRHKARKPALPSIAEATPACKTRNRPVLTGALKCRGSPTIRVDLIIPPEAAPAAKAADSPVAAMPRLL